MKHRTLITILSCLALLFLAACNREATLNDKAPPPQTNGERDPMRVMIDDLGGVDALSDLLLEGEAKIRATYEKYGLTYINLDDGSELSAQAQEGLINIGCPEFATEYKNTTFYGKPNSGRGKPEYWYHLDSRGRPALGQIAANLGQDITAESRDPNKWGCDTRLCWEKFQRNRSHKQ